MMAGTGTLHKDQTGFLERESPTTLHVAIFSAHFTISQLSICPVTARPAVLGAHSPVEADRWTGRGSKGRLGLWGWTGRGPQGLSSEVAGERWPPREGAQVCAHGDLPKGRRQQKHHLHFLPSPCKPEGTSQQPAPSLLVGVPTRCPPQQVPRVGPTQEGQTSQCRYRAEGPKTVSVQGRIQLVPAAPRPEHCPDSGPRQSVPGPWDTREEQPFSRSSRWGQRGNTGAEL